MCRRYVDTARHEIFHGPNRAISKKYGMWIDVCPRCHVEIHKSDNINYRSLKEEAQRKFEMRWGHKRFMDLIMRNYL